MRAQEHTYSHEFMSCVARVVAVLRWIIVCSVLVNRLWLGFGASNHLGEHSSTEWSQPGIAIDVRTGT